MNALDQKINITFSADSTYWLFNDCTPLYQALSAPGGYDPTGMNGFDPNDIDTSNMTLDIYDYNAAASVPTITLSSGLVVIGDIGGTGLITEQFTPADLSYTGTIPDGVFRFTYQITTISTGVTYQVIKYVAKLSSTRCCLDKRLLKVDLCPTCKKDKTVQDLFTALMLSDQVNTMLECKDYTGAQSVISYLKDYCAAQKCEDC